MVFFGMGRILSSSAAGPGEFLLNVWKPDDGAPRNWNETGTELTVVVQARFWQTRWFPAWLALALAGLTSGAAALVRRNQLRRRLERLELQRAKQTERARICRDLHDCLGASLTEIGMLADDQADSNRDLETAGQHFRAISEKVRRVVTDLDAMVWAVDPRQDTLASLASYLDSFVEEYVKASGLTCRIEIPSELPPDILAPESRHNLFLAAKEAVHNAVRHARGTEILLRLAVIGRGLEITVSDNGCGFDSSLNSNGNGLTNLRERLAALNGRCEIISRPGRGTSVKLQVPWPNLDSVRHSWLSSKMMIGLGNRLPVETSTSSQNT
ncbi:MAG: sensor histidine kinase [Verrucomicrobiales bacterium]|nr:sensor histidine kinase [Verrucomicrobiales bacterium]